MKINACLTSNNQIWETPKDIYNMFMNNNYFDPCPINPTFNGLDISWGEKAFVNPPYKDLKQWIKKAIIEKNNGCDIWLLIPARTDTQWFKELYDDYNCEFLFITGRLKFSDKLSAPFPSMFVHCNLKIDYHYCSLISRDRASHLFY